MPNLPDITVTQAQYDRLVATIPGTTNAEKVAYYRQQTRDMWRKFVIDSEVRAAQQAAQADVDAAATAAAGHAANL